MELLFGPAACSDVERGAPQVHQVGLYQIHQSEKDLLENSRLAGFEKQHEPKLESDLDFCSPVSQLDDLRLCLIKIQRDFNFF
jgi:hypothetical protein